MNHQTKTLAARAGCVFVWLGLSSLACSPSNGGGSATPVSEDQFPQAAAKVLCETVAPCCKAAQLAYEETSCKTTAVRDFTSFLTESSTPNNRYDAAAAGNCLSVLKSELEACKSFDEAADIACSAVFVGTVQAGGACTNSGDCVAPNHCKFDPASANATSGVCASPEATEPHGKAGDACLGDCRLAGPTTVCDPSGVTSGVTAYCYQADGLYCAFSTQKCAKYAQLGEPCTADGCVAGTFCNGTVCATPTDSGPCLQGQSACTAKSYCDDGSRLCTPKKADGATCRGPEECATDECAGADGVAQGVCGLGGAATATRCAGHIK